MASHNSMQKKDDKVGNKTANKEERQRKKRERERKIEKDLTKNNNWLVHMREKHKSCFKNYVLLVGKYLIFIFIIIFFYTSTTTLVQNSF